MIANTTQTSSAKNIQIDSPSTQIRGIDPKKSTTQYKGKIVVKSLAYLACLFVGGITANSASAQVFAGPLKKEGVVQACRESGSDFGNLMRVALDVPSDTLSCDFQRASTATKISRACQVTYGGNAFYNIVVSYDNRNAANIPVGRRKGCWR
jgi:hypothetical protein